MIVPCNSLKPGDVYVQNQAARKNPNFQRDSVAVCYFITAVVAVEGVVSGYFTVHTLVLYRTGAAVPHLYRTTTIAAPENFVATYWTLL